MQKQVFEQIRLTCLFQDTNPTIGQGASDDTHDYMFDGILSPSTDGGFLFQETTPRKRDIRNGKLYKGEYVSVVRRQDGLYYPFLKAINAKKLTDKEALAKLISSEIYKALNVIV